MNRVLGGERVTDLCREYGISRKTGDKLKQRFKRIGEAAFVDQSRAPRVIPHRTPAEVVAVLVAERKAHPSWGPRKIKDVLEQRLKNSLPAVSTIGSVLARNGLVKPRKQRPKQPSMPTGLRVANAPNDVWCIDYKGQFRLGNQRYCYPLTMTDQFSRYILCCEGMDAINADAAKEACEEVFRTHGLPNAIRSDNGTPFSSTGLFGLSKLSIYWLRLGLICERIRPGHPEENGQHERMHRTLKYEATRPARTNLLQQQERFDAFVEEFNHVRPHEAIGMKRPAELFIPSTRPYPSALPEPEYPGHDDVLRVTRYGDICIRGRSCYLSKALGGQLVGIREQPEGWLVSFMRLDLGVFIGRKLMPIPPSTPPDAN
jgi:transposase InsO family protein